jgi:cell division protein ZapA (FtsZ GTPase activity inhibitor)
MSTERVGGDAHAVRVTIYNQPYALRSADEGEHVRQAAELVDARMHEIAAHLRGVDALKIAVLAALNIAADLGRAQRLLEREQLKEPEPVPAQTAGQAVPAARDEEAEAWSYEDIFADAPADRRGAGRMAARVADRLQAIRRAEEERLIITADGEET